MRVSLQIDGDASGAKQAAQDASDAVTSLGQSAEDASGKVKDGFDQATGAASKYSDATQNGAAANDNIAGSIAGVAAKVSDLAGKLLGSQSAAAKAAAGVADVASKAAGFATAAGFVSGFATAIGVAVTVATTLYGIINTGSTAANAALQDQGRLIGIVRDAYKDASKTAGEFYEQTKAITALQTQQAIIALQAEQKKQAASIADKTVNTSPGVLISQSAAAEAGLPGLSEADLYPDKLLAFKGAFDQLKASIASGNPDIEKFRDAVAGIGLAAASTNPQIAASAADLLKQTQAAGDTALAIKKAEAIMAVLNGTASEQQKKLLGVATATDQTTNSFDRFANSMDRQSKAQIAEAGATGSSAGALAKLRAEAVLMEAASQSGADGAKKYADRIKEVADRAGEAAQKLSQAKLATDTAFNRDQLGRNSTDAAVADQLRGAYGDHADLNSDIAQQVRLNETLKDIKSTAQDLGSGAFRDFRTEVQQGTGALKAFGDAGVNALQKILDKAADKALDTAISKFIGVLGDSFSPASLISSGPIPGAIGPTSVNGLPLVSKAVGGWTGPGGKYDFAGVVHRDEFVFDKESTNRIGVANLYRAMRGYDAGGLVGSPAPWGPSGLFGGGGNSGAGSAPPWAGIATNIHNHFDAGGADRASIDRLYRAIDTLSKRQAAGARGFANASYQQQFGVGLVTG